MVVSETEKYEDGMKMEILSTHVIFMGKTFVGWGFIPKGEGVCLYDHF